MHLFGRYKLIFVGSTKFRVVETTFLFTCTKLLNLQTNFLETTKDLIQLIKTWVDYIFLFFLISTFQDFCTCFQNWK